LSNLLITMVRTIEKKRGRGKAAAAGRSNKLATEVQDCEPDVHSKGTYLCIPKSNILLVYTATYI